VEAIAIAGPVKRGDWVLVVNGRTEPLTRLANGVARQDAGIGYRFEYKPVDINDKIDLSKIDEWIDS
jgi:hypothetical protein